MNTPRSASPIVEAEAAASRVLEAEHTARAQVAQCEIEAARRVSDANTRAQALRERTEARIARLSARMTAQAEERLQQIRTAQELLAGETGADAATLARLESAIGNLVSEIAGGVAKAPKG
jgi:F0F1-type ATP synthase membrane subunit b/b'